MDNKEIVQNDIADAQDKVQKPQQNLNKDIVKFTKLKNEKESELDNLLNLQISLQNEYANAQHPHVRNRRSGKYLRKICTPSAQIDSRARRPGVRFVQS